MANPSTKNGFIPIASELAEKFASVNIQGQEWRILWVILRKTWGYSNGKRRKDWDWISITQFEKATGMKRSNVHGTLKNLIKKKIINQSDNKVQINQNHEEWVLADRLIGVLAHKLTGVSPQTNKSVSPQTTYNRKIENKTIEILADKSASGYFINKEPITMEELTYEPLEGSKIKGVRKNYARVAIHFMGLKGETGNALRYFPDIKELWIKATSTVGEEKAEAEIIGRIDIWKEHCLKQNISFGLGGVVKNWNGIMKL